MPLVPANGNARGQQGFVRVINHSDQPAEVGITAVDPDTSEVLGADEEDAGFVMVTDTRAKYSVADVVFATRPFEVGDVARQLTRSEGKAVQRMLDNRERARQKRESACRRAQKSRDRNCARDENSSRCRRALAAIEESC